MIVYKHTNKITGKCYIGVTNRTITIRWNEHCRGSKPNKFKNAIKKYGKKNWTHEILDDVTEQKALVLEQKYIIQFNSIENGYNTIPGGSKPPVLYGPKPYVSKALIGNQYWKHRKEYTRTKEHNRKMSLACKGKKHKMTPEGSKILAQKCAERNRSRKKVK